MHFTLEQDRKILEANIGAGGVGLFDLERVKVPTGGITFWEVMVDGTPKPAEKLDVIVLAFRDGRQFWKEKYGVGESGPPDCSSMDLVTGTGDIWEGGKQACASCPYNQWGSAVDDKGNPGAGKACSESRWMLCVRPGDLLPFLLRVPPSSLKAVRSAFLSLGSQRIPYWGVTLELGLRKTKPRTPRRE